MSECICSTCVYGKACVLSSKPPVLVCEEFVMAGTMNSQIRQKEKTAKKSKTAR